MVKLDTSLLEQIEDFCRRNSTSESRFGREAVKDPALVSDLRGGRRLRKRTADRVKAFLSKMQ